MPEVVVPESPSLVLVGAGGFGRETLEVVRAINADKPRWLLEGFLDDSRDLRGSEVEGVPVLGPSEAVERYPTTSVVVCTGSPANYFSRKRLVGRLALAPDRYATLVHPAASIAPLTTLGRGTVALASVVSTASARIGAHVSMMPGVVLTHDDVVGDFVTLASGVRLAGRVTVGEGAYLGAGCLVKEDVRVGPWALIG
ncbi:MAG: acetyltransferase, partial [Acidimicrobiales bacterium]